MENEANTIKEKNKMLLELEVVIGSLATIILLVLVFIASFLEMEEGIRIFLIILGWALFIPGMYYCVKIEQVAGFYECEKCHHKYVPTYKSMLWSMHMGRTRYMKCPECAEKSWQKKVLEK